MLKFETLLTSFPSPAVLLVELNRPNSAMNSALWRDLRECFHAIANDTNVRAVVVSSASRNFSSGIDLQDNPMHELHRNPAAQKWDIARRGYHYRRLVKEMQESFTSMENCPQPVVAAIHGACVGAGVDMITAADVRLASREAKFSIMEVKVGLAADVGTLQRLPKVVGSDSWVRDICLTGRIFDAEEAYRYGLISRMVDGGQGRERVLEEAIKMAANIASLSPVAIAGTKFSLNYARDNSIAQSLDQISTWNAFALQTEDLAISTPRKSSKAQNPSPHPHSNL